MLIPLLNLFPFGASIEGKCFPSGLWWAEIDLKGKMSPYIHVDVGDWAFWAGPVRPYDKSRHSII
jgi:hypothetical protein